MSNSKVKVSKKNKTTVIKVVAKKKKNKTRKVRGDSRLGPFMQLIQDPCNAPLVPGMLGDTYGLISRFRASSFNTSTGNAGYCLWIPQYHQAGLSTSLSGFNLFAFTAATGNLGPTNTVAAPLAYTITGKWQLGGGGFALPDPCASFVSTAGPADSARLVSACMRLSYCSTISNASGQVAWLHGIDMREVVQGNGGQPPTVEQLFNMASKTERFGVDACEIKYSDYDSNDTFVDAAAPWVVGQPGTSATGSEPAVTARAPRAFGFAWDFVEANSALKLEFIKNIEWKPRSTSGLVQPTLHDTGNNLVKPVLAALDATQPGWASTVSAVGRDVLGGKYPLVNNFVTAALTGVMPPRALRGGGSNYLSIMP